MNVQYLVDSDGHKTGVVLSLEEFERLVNLLEEAKDITDFRSAKGEEDEWVSLEEAKKQLNV